MGIGGVFWHCCLWGNGSVWADFGDNCGRQFGDNCRQPIRPFRRIAELPLPFRRIAVAKFVSPKPPICAKFSPGVVRNVAGMVLSHAGMILSHAGMVANLPEIEPNLPEMVANLSEREPDLSEGEPDLSEPEPDLPVTEPDFGNKFLRFGENRV